MAQLSPVYLAEIARQIGFISAFLGGVSATFMVTLLAIDTQPRVSRWAVVGAAGASVALIAAVSASTLLSVILLPSTQAYAGGASIDWGEDA